jgi:hypothetical protein
MSLAVWHHGTIHSLSALAAYFIDERAKVMHLSNESLLVIIFVGIVAGWLAGQVRKAAGLG